jgi:formate dehydrogenase subunit beta
MIDQVRNRVAERLEDLDGIVALRRTSAGTAPHLFRKGDDVSQLQLTPRYGLASIVSMLQEHDDKAKLGIVARGCDVRALVEMAKRELIDPDRLFILGAACTSDEAEECHCADPVAHTEGWPEMEVIGEPTAAGSPDPLLAEYDSLSLEERRAFWEQQFAKCFKCYGCRDICPECFCESCALEDPLWVERGVLGPPFPMFHLIRAMHMAGRCVACRQCELTCPAHIPLTVLYDLMRRDVKDLLGYVPGEDVEALPPLSLTLEEAPLRQELE